MINVGSLVGFHDPLCCLRVGGTPWAQGLDPLPMREDDSIPVFWQCKIQINWHNLLARWSLIELQNIVDWVRTAAE